MAKVKSKKKSVCPKCGAAKRPNTLFCYSCGSRVADGPVSIGALPESNGAENNRDGETQAALDDLAEKFKIEPPDEDKLAKAAAERKKARVAAGRPKKFRWEPVEEDANRLVVLLAILIAVIAGAVVILTVVWK